MVAERVNSQAVQEKIAEFIERLRRGAGEVLAAVVLYGSAASGEFIESRSDVNLLCVFDRLDPETLKTISGVVQWWSRDLHHRPPMVLTLEELEKSADVFAIETLDIKAQNKLLYGRDVLSSIQVPMNLHRVQVEHELRVLLLRLRQHFLLARTSREDLEKALARSASSAITLLRHALIVLEGSAPTGRQALPRAAEALGVDLNSISTVLDLHDGKRVESAIETIYWNYMATLSTVIEKIDHVVPKRDLQRVGKP